MSIKAAERRALWAPRWSAKFFRSCLATVVLAGFPAAAYGQQKAVDLELVLAVDVSASVSPAEFALQSGGLAEAFRDPEVHAAIQTAGGNGIAAALLFWAGPQEQSLVVGWSLVSDVASSVEFAGRIEAARRDFAGVTAIGEAMQFAAQATSANAYSGDRVVIDVSGDGPTNFGRKTGAIRDKIVAIGITVNGLAIINQVEDLVAYYRDHVIGGPGAFVASASDSQDFVRAIRSKLIKEILWRPSS